MYHQLKALALDTRGNDVRFVQAEEPALISIVEYLSENYKVEKEPAEGKYIIEYDRHITYLVEVHIYFEGQIHEVIRSISGYRKPSTVINWEECSDINTDVVQVINYPQFGAYYPSDKINYNDVFYTRLSENGYRFRYTCIPLISSWKQVETLLWQPMEYPLWSVVEYGGEFYTC